MRPDGTKAAFVRAHFAIRPRVSVNAVVIRADGTVEQVIAPDLGSARAKQIIADPRLCEIAKAIAGEITWQRLRVAVEKFGALITGKTQGRTDPDRAMAAMRADRERRPVLPIWDIAGSLVQHDLPVGCEHAQGPMRAMSSSRSTGQDRVGHRSSS